MGGFKKPTLEELKQYSTEIGYNLDCQLFLDKYESKGWVVGRSPMKDWKAAVRTWRKNNYSGVSQPAKQKLSTFEEEKIWREKRRVEYSPWLKSATEPEIRSWLAGLGKGMEWLVKEVRPEVEIK